MGALAWLAIALLLLAAAPTARAVVFVVDTTSNASDALLSDGLCNVGSGQCSLRAAIEQANATAGFDRIEFAIPGPAPHEILIGTAPVILESVVIDATTQPGSSVNTLAVGTNAVFGISLSALFGTEVDLHVDAPNVDIRGFSIHDPSYVDPTFDTGPCVVFGPNSIGSRFRGNRVHGCTGAAAIQVDGDRVRIGDSALASRNRISGNTAGILVTGDDNFIVNNLLGTTASGDMPVGNGGRNIELAGDGNTVLDNTLVTGVSGVTISGDQNTLARNRIGGLEALGLGNIFGVEISGSANQIGIPSAGLVQGNEIFGNAVGVWIEAPGGGNLVRGNRIGGPGRANGGVRISGSSGNIVSENEIHENDQGLWILEASFPSIPAIDNTIRANRIWGNADFNLMLGPSGSPHDDAPVGLAPDLDEGANHLQNPPHITGVSASQGQTVITGNIDARAGSYTLDFFSNPVCSGSQRAGDSYLRAGEYYLGSAALDATGTFTNPRTAFSFTLPVTAQGRGFTATATDVDGNTSEFSACYTAAITGGADLVVTGTSSSSISLDPGAVVPFSIRLVNRGPFVATNVPVVVTLPPGFLSGWSASPGYDAGTGIWTVPSLAVGGLAQLDFEGTVDLAAGGTYTIDARAETGLSQLDPNSLNNAAQINRSVRSGADLVVSQTAPVSAEDGELVSFDVTVLNRGPYDATNVTVTGQLDAGLVFDGSDALPFRFSYLPTTRRWTWDAEDLPDQATASVRVDARVAATLAPDAEMQHTVSAFAASPSDPFPSLSTQVVGLGRAVDLAVTELARSTWNADDDLGFTPVGGWAATVLNRGPGPIEGFMVRVDCDKSRLYVRSTSSVPSSLSCPSSLEEAIECPLVCSVGPTEIDDELLLHFTSDTFDTPDRGVEMITVSIEPDPAFPYFDPNGANDSRTLAATLYRCGLIGIEGPIVVGLVMLLRRRKERAAIRRSFPGAALALALLLGGSARTADATPVTLAIDSSASSATVSITSPLGSPPPVSVSLSGSLDADVSLGIEAPFGLVGQSLQLTGGAIALSDFSIGLSSLLLYDLAFTGSGVGGRISGPSATGFAAAPGLSLFDLFGASLSFDTGTIDTNGTYYGFPVSETFDLADFPFVSVFAANSVSQLQVVDLGAGAAGLRLAIPFSAPFQLVFDSEPVTMTIAGTLVVAGPSVVPEPGTATLLALGLVVLAARRRSHDSCSS